MCEMTARVVDRRQRMRSRPVVRQQRWEWPGLAEVAAMVVVGAVVLAAGVGMLLRMALPRRHARVMVTAVQQVAGTAGAVASTAVQQVTETAAAAALVAHQAAEKAVAVAGDALVAAEPKPAPHTAG